MDKQSARKFLYITLGITAAIIALSIFLVVQKRNEKLALTVQTPDVVSSEEDVKLDAEIKKALDSIDFENFDTDKDGVPDWQENIYGLNPASAQTYGEGTSDKAFVENVESDSLSKGSVYSNLEQSKTALVAQDIYKLSKNITSEEDLQNVGDGVIDSIKNIQVGKQYSEDEIKYNSDYKPNYNQYLFTIIPYFKTHIVTEADIDQINGDPDETNQIALMRQIKSKIDVFESVLINTKPPKSWVGYHAEVINASLEMSSKLGAVLDESADTVIRMAAITTLSKSFVRYSVSLHALTSVIIEYAKKQ